MNEVLEEMKPKVNALLQPVGELVVDKDIDQTVRRLRAILEIPGDGVRFTGEQALFNPLLELANRDATAFRALVRLVMKKRANRNLPYTPLKALLAGESDAERAKWQEEAKTIAAEMNRGYVAAMRDRLRRLVKIENMTRRSSDQLVGKARLDFTARMWNEWAIRRLKTLEAAAAHKPGHRLSRAEQRQVVEDFRDTIDRELDELEAQARRKMLQAH